MKQQVQPKVLFPLKISLSSAVVWLVVVHFFGILGLLLPFSRPWFELATPLSLMLSVLLLLYFHSDWNGYFIAFLVFTYMAGFGIEVAGVKTSMIFGSYAYKTTLGYKWLDVPLMIGINWLILTYTSCVVCFSLKLPIIVKSILAALLMTAMDFLIEPVAILHNYWEWHGAAIPIQNYTAWFFVSFTLCLVFYLLPFDKKNPLAKYLLIVQLFFFLLLQFGHKMID